MRKVVGAVIVAVGFVFAHGVWLAQDVPVTSAADEGTAPAGPRVGELAQPSPPALLAKSKGRASKKDRQADANPGFNTLLKR